MIITEATKQKGRDKHGAGGKSEKPGNGNGRLPPNDMKRFYVNGRHLLREIAGLYVLICRGDGRATEPHHRAERNGTVFVDAVSAPVHGGRSRGCGRGAVHRAAGRNAARHRKLCTGRAARRAAARGFRCGKNGRKGGIK